MRELCQGAASSGAVLTGQVLLRLHLDEPARGALKLPLQALALIQRPRRGGGGYHEVDVAIVQFIDQHDEAARSVLVGAREHRYVRK